MAVEAAIVQAWSELMPAQPLDLALTWGAAGVDSLKAMHLVFRLEELIGKSIPLDLLSREKTLNGLINSLNHQTPLAPLSNERCDIFLFPGIFGDEFRLAAFRKEIEPWVQCQTLDVADLRTPAPHLASLDVTCRTLVKEIIQSNPTGPLVLAGYSFGGFLAYQVAIDLIAAGYEIELLCLLDTLTASSENLAGPPSANSQPEEATDGLTKRKGEASLKSLMERILFRFAMAIGSLEFARRVVIGNWHVYSPKRAQWRREEVLRTLRLKALKAWKPGVMSAPVLLIASDDCLRLGCEKVWRTLCSNLTVCYVGGNHYEIFSPGPMRLLKPALFAALGVEENELDDGKHSTQCLDSSARY